MKIEKTTSMRDALFGTLYEMAKKDKEIVVVTGDMGAPSLDQFRADFPERFFNVGIAEQNMIAVAAGLASEGKKVYTFAIAPFATSRCFEFTKLNAGLMKLPIKVVGVGAGFSYDDSGPTHHTTEDISIMRTIPHLEIYSPADSVSAAKIAEMTVNSKSPSYLRLDRKVLPIIYSDDKRFTKGFEEYVKGEKVAIVTTGNMVHTALEISERFPNDSIGVIDLYRIKPVSPLLAGTLKKYQRILTLEEHLLDGGLGSIIAETVIDNNIPVRVKRMGLRDFIYAYGGRENIEKVCGIDPESVAKEVERLL
jgi:transketolase